MLPSKKYDTWVIVADSTNCQIYEYSKSPIRIQLLKEWSHLENQLRDSDYVADRQGSFNCIGSVGGHGTFAASSDPKKNKVFQFSKEIANLLEHDRKLNAFKHLILISPPYMNGLIQQNLSKHLRRFLDLSIGKSVKHYDKQALISFIRYYTQLH